MPSTNNRYIQERLIYSCPQFPYTKRFAQLCRSGSKLDRDSILIRLRPDVNLCLSLSPFQTQNRFIWFNNKVEISKSQIFLFYMCIYAIYALTDLQDKVATQTHSNDSNPSNCHWFQRSRGEDKRNIFFIYFYIYQKLRDANS